MLKNNKSLLIYVGVIALVAVAARLLPHIPNTAPVGALALFLGLRLSGWHKIPLLLVVLFVTDLLIGFYNPYVMLSVYGSFLLILALGSLNKKYADKFSFVLGGSLLGSFLFFIITNAAVWAFGTMYTHTWAGLILCYALALPFFGYTLLGDIFWNTAFYSGHAFVQKRLFASTRLNHFTRGGMIARTLAKRDVLGAVSSPGRAHPWHG